MTIHASGTTSSNSAAKAQFPTCSGEARAARSSGGDGGQLVHRVVLALSTCCLPACPPLPGNSSLTCASPAGTQTRTAPARCRGAPSGCPALPAPPARRRGNGLGRGDAGGERNGHGIKRGLRLVTVVAHNWWCTTAWLHDHCTKTSAHPSVPALLPPNPPVSQKRSGVGPLSSCCRRSSTFRWNPLWCQASRKPACTWQETRGSEDGRRGSEACRSWHLAPRASAAPGGKDGGLLDGWWHGRSATGAQGNSSSNHVRACRDTNERLHAHAHACMVAMRTQARTHPAAPSLPPRRQPHPCSPAAADQSGSAQVRAPAKTWHP